MEINSILICTLTENFPSSNTVEIRYAIVQPLIPQGLHLPVLHDGSPVGVGVSVLDLLLQGVHIHHTDGPALTDPVPVLGLQVLRVGSAGDITQAFSDLHECGERHYRK